MKLRGTGLNIHHQGKETITGLYLPRDMIVMKVVLPILQERLLQERVSDSYVIKTEEPFYFNIKKGTTFFYSLIYAKSKFSFTIINSL